MSTIFSLKQFISLLLSLLPISLQKRLIRATISFFGTFVYLGSHVIAVFQSSTIVVREILQECSKHTVKSVESGELKDKI